MKKKKSWMHVLILLSVLAGACALAPAGGDETPQADLSFEIEDSRSIKFQFDGPAQRIISLAPSNTEILFGLGAGEQVIGRDEFSDYPAEAAQVENIGGGWGDYDVELIVSLNPDLVLAADIIALEQIKAMEDLGLKVFLLANPDDFEGLYHNLEIAGKLCGKPEQAAAMIESFKSRVAEVEAKIKSVDSPPLVFYELDSTDPNAPWTSGAGTFIDTMITMAGGDNLGRSLEGAWAQISIEALIDRDPQVIILGDATWGGVTPEAVKARAGWATIHAVREDQVFPFDDNLVSRPGPRMVDGLEEMARLLHPDLFE